MCSDPIGRMNQSRRASAWFAFLRPPQCSPPSRSFIRLVGDEVVKGLSIRVSVPFALNANGVKTGSRPSLAGSKTGQRTRH